MAMRPVSAGSLVGERLGKYHLLALIAVGGTAEIYLARIGGEAGFEKYVVVKCLLDHLSDDSEFLGMFLDEARLCAQLDHSNIVQTLELGQHEGRYYIVMEHLAGLSLAQLARKTHERTQDGFIPTRIVLGLAAQACAGLHYAHGRIGSDGGQLNVVHRDVSPQNLVVTFEGMLKIVDFGIAKASRRQSQTSTGTIKGKFAYMSPEQCLAEPIDRRTDVFALGTVVHELLTARRLFKRTTAYETVQAILQGDPPPPSHTNPTLDEALDRVVLRALGYAKEERYETTEAFGEAMLGWLHSRGQSVSATDVSRFVEKVCTEEVEEHAAHMRRLVSGHRVATAETLRWDSSAEEEAESLLVAGPMGNLASRECDDFDVDTQIELDPLERVAALEAAALTASVPAPSPGGAGGRRAAGSRNDPAAETGAGPTVAGKKRGLGVPLVGRATADQRTVPATDGPVAPGSRSLAAQRTSWIETDETPVPGFLGPMWSEESGQVRPGQPSPHAPQPRPPRPHDAAAGLSPDDAFFHPPSPGPVWRTEEPSARDLMPIWVLVIAFLIAAAVGLGLTVLIGSLVS